MHHGISELSPLREDIRALLRPFYEFLELSEVQQLLSYLQGWKELGVRHTEVHDFRAHINTEKFFDLVYFVSKNWRTAAFTPIKNPVPTHVLLPPARVDEGKAQSHTELIKWRV